MGVLGATGGSAIGKAIGGDGIGGDILGAIGGIAGGFLPFETGGEVPRNTKALLHKGEYVLPAGVKPTKTQRKAVNKRKAQAKKGKKGKKGKQSGKVVFV
tara:strand:- start:1546 stop:1845 length:300 start_codon:yes stop_codon:yes gene_type:complete